jgi:ribosome-binding factor A
MLAGTRAERVGDQIVKEIAILLLDRVNDPRVKGVTVTGVRLARDLRSAKVYYSVIGETDAVSAAQAGLDSAKGFIKRHLGLRLKLRYVPDIRFVHDETMRHGEHMERLLERVLTEEERNGELDADPPGRQNGHEGS